MIQQDFYSKMFTDLQAYLKANVSELRTVDQNLAQYNHPGFAAPTILPAVFIDFPNTQYSALNHNDQLGLANIDLVLMFQPWSQSGQNVPTGVRELALDYYRIEAKIVALLQGWTPGYCTELVRVSDESLNRNELGYRIRNLKFTCEFEYLHQPVEPTDVTFVFNGSISSNSES